MNNKLLIFVIFFLTCVSLVSAIDIDSCGVLNEGGETYTLIEDIESDGTCFEITNNDITLDCNGHSIIGDGRWDSGVEAIGGRITITNCEISGFEDGISLCTYESEVINNNLYGNDVGIMLIESELNTIIDK